MDENVKFKPKEYYREKIVEMVKEINNTKTLIKILKVVETHLKILKGEI